MEKAETMFTPFEDLKLSDNFIFSAVMRDINNCKELLEVILGVKIVKISRSEIEKTINNGLKNKGIRLDVYVENDDTVYDVEMQTTSENLPKRTRYYQALIDKDILPKGEDYKKMKKSIIIFICTFDVFKKNLPVYSFANVCLEDKSIVLEDDMLKIFLNTSGSREGITQSLSNLYDLINDGVAKDDFTKRLSSDINIIKNDGFWREHYMGWYLEIEEAKLKGMEEGLAKGKVEALLTIGYDTAKIAETLNMPVSEVEKIAESVNVTV